MYHISDIKKFLRCELLYFYGRDEINVFKPYLRSDENIVELLKQYFRIDSCFEGIRNDNTQRFFDNISEYEWFFHPRFNDGELRINIPLLHRLDDAYDVYFIQYSTQNKELDLLSYRIMTQILKKYQLRLRKVFLIGFNSDYVNDGKLDVDKLFICSERFKNKKIIDLIEREEFDYQSVIDKMSNTASEDYTPQKNRYCKLYGLCSFYERCFPEEETIGDDSILTLVSSRNKEKMYQDGIRSLKDADVSLLEGNKVQYAQIMAARKNGTFIDKSALSCFLSRLDERPISFIDFEWDRYLIPAYYGMKPLDVVCFEFALYYIDENGQMEHRTFVSTGDCRKEFVEALLEYLPAKGPILAYNATGAECLRLKELGKLFPEYQEKLEAIIERFIDLAVPFMEGVVYDVRMKGNFSLKQLVDICSDYSYHDLDIFDGMEAVFNWRNIDKNQDEDGEKIIEELREYCSLDAYGLFLVYRWLVQLMIESK